MNGTSTQYQISCDPYLGIGKCKIKMTPYDYIGCRNSMDLPWDPYIVPKDQPILFLVKKRKYDQVLGEHKNW